MWQAKGDPGRALAAYSMAIKIDPKDDASYYGRGMARAGSRDYDGAIADFDEAIKLDPGNADYLVSRKAAVAARAELQLGAESAVPQADNDTQPDAKLSIADMAELIQATDPRILAAVRHGDSLLDAGKYDQAIGAYGKAIALDPDSPLAYFGRGKAWDAKRVYDRATTDYDRVIKLLPNMVSAYVRRGMAKATSEDAEGALADCGRAAALDPKVVDAYFCMGMAWHVKGDTERAITAYSAAIGIDAKDAPSYYARGIERADGKDYSGAIADFD